MFSSSTELLTLLEMLNNGAVYDLYELLSVSSPQMVIHIKILYVACFGTKRILLVFLGGGVSMSPGLLFPG